MRQRIFGLLMVMLVSVSLAFASGADESGQEQITLTGMVRDYSLDRYEEPWHSAVERFVTEHPNVTIELEGLPYDDQREKTLIAVGAGAGPDVVMVDCIWLGEFASNDIIIDLTDRIAAVPGLKDSYIGTFQESMTWNGRDYGLWTWTDVRMLAYNKDMFRAAGLNPDDPPESWEELREYARALNQPDAGTWGYAFPAFSTDHTADRWYPFLWANGGEILTDDLTEAAFNSRAGVEALQLLVDLMNEDEVSPRDLLGIPEGDVSQGFVAGAYAMAVKCGNFLSDFPDLSVEEYREKIGQAPLPIPQGGQIATGSGGWLVAITRDSEVPDLAFEFLQTVVDSDNMIPFYEKNSALPTKTAEMELVDSFAEVFPYFDVVQQVLPNTHFRPAIPEYQLISAEIVDAIQSALLLEATPQQALNVAAENVNQILSEREW
jgi:multiple sugar transport system substrate-binding protein